MGTITTSQIERYEDEGWRITNREGLNVTIEKKSCTAGDIGRSIGYIVGAPVVFGLSLAGSVLAIGCGACSLIAGGTVIKEEGPRKYAVYDPNQAKFADNMAEGCCLEIPCEVVRKTNTGFFRWVAPFQSTTYTKTFTLEKDTNE